MPKLKKQSVDFAKRHISRFYDTDFFPKHFALEAVWHNWAEAKALLTGTPLEEIPLDTPTLVTWPKPRGGYRIVHQLDPISSLVYAAAVHRVSRAIESARQSEEARIACSYRISLSKGSFFESGTGYTAFRQRTNELCERFAFVLLTDITDFYNQIYVHRVRNAVSTADGRFDKEGLDLEKLLLRWNSRVSQGIPVGPAPSIIVSEAVLIDVDRFIVGRGLTHIRYVDDFRIFADSEMQLRSVLRDLTTYLYEVHRLNLAAEKTKLMTTDEFSHETLQNQYEIEKVEIFEGVEEVISPYDYGGDGEEEDEDEDEDDEDGDALEESPEATRDSAVAALQDLLSRVLNLPSIDLGLARAVLRKAKGLGVTELVPMVLGNSHKLIAVINDVFLYLREIAKPPFVADLVGHLERAAQSDIAEEPAFRIWADWLITSSPVYLDSAILREYVVRGGAFFSQARIAVMDRNVAWVREQRAAYSRLPPDSRLAVLFASPVLARDEREPWLRAIAKSAASPKLERWFAQAVLDDAVDHKFAVRPETPF